MAAASLFSSCCCCCCLWLFRFRFSLFWLSSGQKVGERLAVVPVLEKKGGKKEEEEAREIREKKSGACPFRSPFEFWPLSALSLVPASLSRAPRAQSPRIVALKQLLDRSRGSVLRERWTESEREGAFGARSPLFQFNSFETVGSSPIALVFSRPLRGALGPLPGFLPPAGRRHDGDAAFYGGKRGKKRPEKTRRTSEFATAKRTQRRWRSG